ncbi:MAG: twin transmembrane helix small protein [Paracoccaceae bacterium]
MFSDPLAIIATISVLIVLAILMAGIGSFGRGGSFALKHSNRLMRYRVGAQAVAVLLIVIFAWLRSGGN